MKLYEITNEIRMLERMMDEEDVDEASFSLALAGLNDSLESKAKNIGLLVKELRSDIDQRKQAIDALKKSNESDSKRIEWLMNYLKANLDEPISSPLVKISFRAGVDSVQIEDEDLVPAEFIKTVRSVMKADIKIALRQGESVPGCSLSTGPKSVVVK